MNRPLFIVTNILLPLLAVVAMIFVFWHWKGYPLPASLTSGKVGAMVAKLKRLKAEKVYMVRQKLHQRDCLGELRFFKLADQVFACENKETGRWFLHFLEDGSIQIGLPPGAIRRYHPASRKLVPVDLEEVFAEPATFQRTTFTVISVHSPHGPRHFRLQPDYSIADPALACQNLTLEEIGSDPIPPFRITLVNEPLDWEQLSAETAPETTSESKPAMLPEVATESAPEAGADADSQTDPAAAPGDSATDATPSATAAPATTTPDLNVSLEPAPRSLLLPPPTSSPALKALPAPRPGVAPYPPLKPSTFPAILPADSPPQ